MRQTRKRKKPLEPKSAGSASSKAKKAVQSTDSKSTVGKAPANPDTRLSLLFDVVEEGDHGETAFIEVRIDNSILVLKCKAVETLGQEAIPNLLALGDDGCVAYLPTHIEVISLPLPSGLPLLCASLPGLRSELAQLADAWELPIDDDALLEILASRQDPDDGWVADPPEILTFARLGTV